MTDADRIIALLEQMNANLTALVTLLSTTGAQPTLYAGSPSKYIPSRIHTSDLPGNIDMSVLINTIGHLSGLADTANDKA